ncbi:hypothetical protein BJX99DRAFT_238613 [Aspergillus californicus]
MSATLGPMQPFSNPNPSYHAWTPARPSPLSPRRASSSFNMTATTQIQQPQLQSQSQSQSQTQIHSPSSLFTFSPAPSTSSTRNSSNSEPDSSRTTTHSRTSPNYANRYKAQISNPFSNRTRSALTSTSTPASTSTTPSTRTIRRNVFLNRVKQDRDSGRFENRAEQLLFLEGIAEQKEWDELMRRRAQRIESTSDYDDGYGLDEEDFEGEDPESEFRVLDEYLEQERALEMETEMLEPETDTMFDFSNAGQYQEPMRRGGTANSSFSDNEYDDLFMDLVDGPSQDMDMDMSG